MPNKNNLLAHEAYMENYKARGGNWAVMQCPHCDAPLDTPIPSNSHEKWDSLIVCPHCDGLYMKIATKDWVKTLTPPYGLGSQEH